MNTTHKTKLGIEILERRQMLTVLTFADVQTIGFVDGSVKFAAFIDFFDNDSVDIISASGGSTNLHIGDGQNRFSDSDQLISNSWLLGIFDIDGDTTKDLVFGQMLDTESAYFRWYRNDPVTRQLDKVVDWNGLSGAANVIDAADIDGDGDLDLAGGFAYTHHATYQRIASIQWYENVDGIGTFELRTIEDNPNGFGGNFAKLVDLDSDGDADLVTNNAWYENLGAVFSKHALDGKPLVDVGDVDGDGDIDLVTEARRFQIGWRENSDGAGTFAAQRTIDGAIRVRPQSIQLSDMDLDGDLDLLAIDLDRDTLNWYENYNGEGDFGRRQLIAENIRNIYFVDSMDIDGDNDIDIVTGKESARGTRLILLEGQGPVTPGDSNGDGVFNSSDLVHVFQAGEYEDHLNDNSTFEEGDWNGDSEFNSSDFVFVFQKGNYVADAITTPNIQAIAARIEFEDHRFDEEDPWDQLDDWWDASAI